MDTIKVEATRSTSSNSVQTNLFWKYLWELMYTKLMWRPSSDERPIAVSPHVASVCANTTALEHTTILQCAQVPTRMYNLCLHKNTERIQ